VTGTFSLDDRGVLEEEDDREGVGTSRGWYMHLRWTFRGGMRRCMSLVVKEGESLMQIRKGARSAAWDMLSTVYRQNARLSGKAENARWS